MTSLSGYFRVNESRLVRTSNRFILLFTKDRLIAAKLSSEWGDPESVIKIMGLGGGLFGGPLGVLGGSKIGKKFSDKPRKIIKKRFDTIIRSKTANETLKMNKDNFQIFYRDIDNVILKKAKIKSRLGTVEIKGKENVKFVIPLSEDLPKIKKLLKGIFKDKLEYGESLM